MTIVQASHLLDTKHPAWRPSPNPFTMSKISIDIYSDTLCPWCYIGKRQLDSAISAYSTKHPDTEFELTWHPFLLHPKTRASGIPKRTYFSAKYGPGADAFLAKVETTGEPLNIKFDWGGNSGSSYDSQKLVIAAETWEIQSRFLDLLFRGHFEESRDISDRDFLVECAMQAGLAGTEQEAARAKDAWEEELYIWVEDKPIRALERGQTALSEEWFGTGGRGFS
ncbi:hypothetical protein DL546_009032 [Coniochaeta pulveracea]|uniref:DSBA-like thioredoxin domain-containing protein n=1 Tax=Coniochaeta pulveracea TaxID=177199 RepID=A0A420YLA5_9PEZI|nr:hypothetical protein DL546_009032 [Coniochaeta pulveracea]